MYEQIYMYCWVLVMKVYIECNGKQKCVLQNIVERPKLRMYIWRKIDPVPSLLLWIHSLQQWHPKLKNSFKKRNLMSSSRKQGRVTSWTVSGHLRPIHREVTMMSISFGHQPKRRRNEEQLRLPWLDSIYHRKGKKVSGSTRHWKIILVSQKSSC